MQLLILASGGCIGFIDTSQIQAMQILRPTIAAFTGREMDDIASEIIKTATSANCFKKMIYDIAMSVAAQSMEYDTPVPWFFDQMIVKPFKQNLGGRLRLLISTISWLQPRVQHLLRIVLHIPVIQIYGTAETGGVICAQNVHDKQVDVVGGPSTVCEIRLRDHEGRIRAACDDQGELMVRGKNVFKGYQSNKAATKRVLSEDGWFATGDLVRLLPNGSVEVNDTIQRLETRKVALNKVVTPKLSFM